MQTKSIWIGLVAMATVACDWRPPQSDEGLVNTLVSEDSLAAHDSAARSLFADSSRLDNTLTDSPLPPPPAGGAIDTRGVSPGAVVDFAETLIGTPYLYGSTDPARGFDCSGFITHVFNHFSIQVPRSSIDFTQVGKEIPEKAARRGDIVLFTGTDSSDRHVGHMGLVVANDASGLRFIHATSGKAMGVTITPLNNYYRGRFVKTIRIFPER